MSAAEACNAELAALQTSLASGQLLLQDAVKHYQQYVAKHYQQDVAKHYQQDVAKHYQQDAVKGSVYRRTAPVPH